MIRFENVQKQFGQAKVLQGVTFEVKAGEFLVILGPSGAGKSTLLRCANGLVPPSDGSIYVNGMQVTRHNLHTLRKDIGFIFQHYNIVGNMNVMNNVLIGTLGRKSYWNFSFRREDRQAAEQAIAQVGLADKAFVRADKLSGGQKQRVGIARALVQEPKVILADEPVSNLDPVIGLEILSLLQTINETIGTTIICNLHHVEYARRFGHRIIGISGGRTVFDGKPAELDEKQLAAIYAAPALCGEAEGSSNTAANG